VYPVSDGRVFAHMHSIQFIEASPDRSCPAPFPTLLSLVRQHYEAQAPVSPSIGEGVMDLLTVAAARVSHVARSHLPALPLTPTRRRTAECPPRVRRCDLAGSLSPPGWAISFCLVLGIYRVSCALGRPRDFVRNLAQI